MAGLDVLVVAPRRLPYRVGAEGGIQLASRSFLTAGIGYTRERLLQETCDRLRAGIQWQASEHIAIQAGADVPAFASTAGTSAVRGQGAIRYRF